MDNIPRYAATKINTMERSNKQLLTSDVLISIMIEQSKKRMYTSVSHFPGINPCTSLFTNKERAINFIKSKAKDLITRGDFVMLGANSIEPAPVKQGSTIRVGGSNSHPVMRTAPAHVECCVHEINLLRLKDNVKCFYRVIQSPIT